MLINPIHHSTPCKQLDVLFEYTSTSKSTMQSLPAKQLHGVLPLHHNECCSRRAQMAYNNKDFWCTPQNQILPNLEVKDQWYLNADSILILAMCNLYACSQPRHSHQHLQADAFPLQSRQPWHFPIAISSDEQYCITLMQPKGHAQRSPSGISTGKEASSSEKTL